MTQRKKLIEVALPMQAINTTVAMREIVQYGLVVALSVRVEGL